MKIVIGSDHAGFSLKAEVIEFLKSEGHEVNDAGIYEENRADYPDIAAKVVAELRKDDSAKGIIICGTGIGISIAANKHKGIRAALCSEEFSARYSVMHNNANILAIGARTTSGGLACSIVKAYLEAQFEGGRHADRIAKIHAIEEREL